jgi:hypothetical protein
MFIPNRLRQLCRCQYVQILYPLSLMDADFRKSHMCIVRFMTCTYKLLNGSSIATLHVRATQTVQESSATDLDSRDRDGPSFSPLDNKFRRFFLRLVLAFCCTGSWPGAYSVFHLCKTKPNLFPCSCTTCALLTDAADVIHKVERGANQS